VKLKVLDKQFELSASFLKEVKGFPNDPKDESWHNEFRVKVVRFLEDGKISRSFKFYGSMHDWEKSKRWLKGNDLIHAFYCFLSDAQSGTYSLEDFCSEFGYDLDSRRAERIYKQCQKSMDKLFDMGIFESEVCDLLNEIQEKYEV